MGALALIAPVLCAGDTAYYQKSFFDNSLAPRSYFYSSGKSSAPSKLMLVGDKLPVDGNKFLTPPNSLQLHWTSRLGGGWVASIGLYEWRNREAFFPGDVLAFWCYSREGMLPEDLPLIAIQDKGNGFSEPVALGEFAEEVPRGKWIQIRIPLARFVTASLRELQPHRVNKITFLQGRADGREHTLFIDEIRFTAAQRAGGIDDLHVPQSLKARGFERHVDLSWIPATAGSKPERYVIYRSLQGADFRPIGIQVPGVNRFEDFLGSTGMSAVYRVKASDGEYRASNFSNSAAATTHAMDDDALLTMVEEACFRYYWEGAHPVSGMIRENIPGEDRIVATGATGFGIMALVVGTDRSFENRAPVVQRLLKITDFLQRADRFHGAWPHFIDGATGHRIPVFDMFDNGADLVETSFLMEGLLTARQYFNGASGDERELRQRISRLWNDVEWDWFRRTPQGKALYWHWSPEYSWYVNHPLYGWNEVMITYLLAIASPAHGVPESLYSTGWAGDSSQFLNGRSFFGIKLDLGTGTGGPLFFTHYSYMGFDPRGKRDRFTNYFDNNRRMALINRQYCIRNPGGHDGYGKQTWGITAVDGPKGYIPYEPNRNLDDGTIAPTGAIASIPYTPEASLAALKYFYRELGDRLWDVYGFRDAFNLEQTWFSGINMGLNQAPMAVMIENYRTGLIWKNFMANPEIQPTLRRIGFQPDREGQNYTAK